MPKELLNEKEFTRLLAIAKKSGREYSKIAKSKRGKFVGGRPIKPSSANLASWLFKKDIPNHISSEQTGHERISRKFANPADERRVALASLKIRNELKRTFDKILPCNPPERERLKAATKRGLPRWEALQALREYRGIFRLHEPLFRAAKPIAEKQGTNKRLQ